MKKALERISYLFRRIIAVFGSEGIGGFFKAVGRYLKSRRIERQPVDYRYDFVAKVKFPKSVSLTLSKRELDVKSLVLNWVIPDFGVGSGGHLNIFRMIHYLEKFGHKNRLYIFRPAHHFSGRQAKEAINRHFVRLEGEVEVGVSNIEDSDATIATSWQTAYPVYNVRNTRKKFYFIQDLEPLFYPSGSEAKFAETTYKFGFDCITAGPWLTRIMREKYGLKSDYFEFAYDPEIYQPLNQERKKQILFYARRVTPRRGFELGVLALKLVLERHPDYELLFAGWSDHARLSFGYRNLGILRQDELAVLYNESMLGLVISLTNPSLVIPEMMACKLPVVDVLGDNTTGFFGDNNLVLANPDPLSLADAICELIENPQKQGEVSERAYSYVRNLSWERSAREVEKIIVRGLKEESK